MPRSISAAMLTLALAIPAFTATAHADYIRQRGDDPRLRQIHAQCMLKDEERWNVDGDRLINKTSDNPNITTMEQINHIADQFAQEGYRLFRVCMEAKGALVDETCAFHSLKNRFCYSIPKTENVE